LIQKSEDEAANKARLKIIKEQTDKMSVMAAELLTLSKIDETETKVMTTQFDISQMTLTEILSCESVVFEHNKVLDYETGKDIIYKGDAGAVRQAVGILCDNAIKHSDEGGVIEIRLKKQGTKPALHISNTGSTVKEEEIPMLFERFYRGSESRAEVDGSGLGLAILKALAEKNGWELDVSTSGDKITFSIIF
jgi:signal transduction histidine kinase